MNGLAAQHKAKLHMSTLRLSVGVLTSSHYRIVDAFNPLTVVSVDFNNEFNEPPWMMV